MKTLTTVLVAGTAGLVVLSTAGLATASPTASSANGTVGKAGSHHRLLTAQQRQTLRSTGHVEVVRHSRKHGDVTLEVQRGAITALTPTTIPLLSKGGYRHTYLLTPATTVREKGKAENVSDLTAGERVMVVAVHSPTADVARRINCVRAPRKAPTSPTSASPTT